MKINLILQPSDKIVRVGLKLKIISLFLFIQSNLHSVQILDGNYESITLNINECKKVSYNKIIKITSSHSHNVYIYKNTLSNSVSVCGLQNGSSTLTFWKLDNEEMLSLLINVNNSKSKVKPRMNNKLRFGSHDSVKEETFKIQKLIPGWSWVNK